MKFSDKQIKLFRGISIVAGIFTMLIAFTMLFSLIQLKSIDPLNNPAVVSVKEQFDSDPENRQKAEQVRAMDLMARKAYFTSRWQVETGSYLLLAGAVIFVVFQRMLAGNEKLPRPVPGEKPDINAERIKNRRYLVISAASVTLLAIVSSFVLRSELPDTGKSDGKEGTLAQKGSMAVPAELSDVNFPAFRGEGTRGIAGGSGYPTDWNGEDGTNVRWKIPVPKHGKSSPVIWGDRIFVTGADGSDLEIYCIDKNKGEILWTVSGSSFEGASKDIPEGDPEAGLAVCTPAVCEDAVCAIFSNGNLVSYSLDGKLKWAKNLGVPQHMYGFSSSLVISGKDLIIQYESETRFSLICIDVNSGEIKWETARTGRPVNSSPVIAYFDGIPQIIINGSPNVTSYDLSTGKEIWTIDGVKNDVAASPAVNNRFIYAVANYERLFAISPGRSPSLVWEDNTYTPDVSSPVATDEFLFVADGAGSIACYKADQNTILWEQSFNDPFYASPIIADGKVWSLDRSGIMYIVKAQDKYELVSQSKLGESSDCTPAFSEGQIYIRGEKNLYCISAK